jgi:hypothetical protein
MDTVITIGPWQSIIASAAIHQLQIAPDQVRVITVLRQHESHLFSICKQIHDTLGHTIDSSIILHNREKPSQVHQDAIKLLNSSQRVWVPGLSHYISELLLYSKCPSIAVYEDGINSLSPQFTLSPYWNQQFRLSHIILNSWRTFLYRKNGRIPPHRLHKLVTGVFTYLDLPYLQDKTIPYTHISKESILNILDKSFPSDANTEGSNRKRALILGCNFSFWNVTTPTEEYTPIISAIEFLQNEYEVWWKPHPRADRLFTDYLSLRFPSLNLWPNESIWIPVEAMIKNMNVSFIASPMSSSLIYCKSLWGIDSKIIPGIKQHIINQNNKGFLTAYQYLEEHIPLLDISANIAP